jgi:hypothetical protein
MVTPCSSALEQLKSEKEALLALLKQTRTYVNNAYECAFPDEDANQRLLNDIDAALSGNILAGQD